MTLYEIDQEIADCLDLETGEVIDEETLDELQMTRESKIENIACWYKSLIAEAEALKNERDKLEKRRKSKENQAESLKCYLANKLDGIKFETPRAKISWRKSEAVKLVDESLIPDIYKTKVVATKISKDDIKKAIRSGASVPGAELEKKTNIHID